MKRRPKQTIRFPKGVRTINFPMWLPLGRTDPWVLWHEQREKHADKIPTIAKTKLVVEVGDDVSNCNFVAYK